MTDNYDIWGNAQALNNTQSDGGLSFSTGDAFGSLTNPTNLSLEYNTDLTLSNEFGVNDSSNLALNPLPNDHTLVFNSAHSPGDEKPYITIDQFGDVYRHDRDNFYHHVGHVRNNTYYNNRWDEIGYLKDGHYYDASNDRLQGSICGVDVYDNNHHKIAVAETATEGGAWIAFIQHGGIA